MKKFEKVCSKNVFKKSFIFFCRNLPYHMKIMHAKFHHCRSKSSLPTCVNGNTHLRKPYDDETLHAYSTYDQEDFYRKNWMIFLQLFLLQIFIRLFVDIIFWSDFLSSTLQFCLENILRVFFSSKASNHRSPHFRCQSHHQSN